MPLQTLELTPGVNTLRTKAQQKGGVINSQYIRYQNGLPQKLGGWTEIAWTSTATSSGAPRSITAWIAEAPYLQYGLAAASTGAVTFSFSSIPTPSTSPLALANGLANGPVTFTSIIPGSLSDWTTVGSSYEITFSNSAAGSSIVGPALTGDTVVFGIDATIGGIKIQAGIPYYVTVYSTYTATFDTSYTGSSAAGSGISTPTFSTTALNSAGIAVTLPSHGNNVGDTLNIAQPMSFVGQTLQGAYPITSVTSSNQYGIYLTKVASATGSSIVAYSSISTTGAMPVTYYRDQGGDYAHGTMAGVAGGPGGTLYTSSDCVTAPYGNYLLLCYSGGPIWYFNPALNVGWRTTLTSTTQQTPNADTYNAPSGAPIIAKGFFVSSPAEIIVAYGCNPFGSYIADPLQLRWSDAGNLYTWTPDVSNQAGGARLQSRGSVIMGGIQGPSCGLIWTDLELWLLIYIGYPLVFQTMLAGVGCGIVGQHAAGILAGTVAWMGQGQFFSFNGTSVTPIPCPVWDNVFPVLDVTNAYKVCCAVNSVYNEIAWYYPIQGGGGENTNYVKLHMEGNEFEWDVGTLIRTAWIDESVFGFPIGSDSTGDIFQHDTTFDAAGAAMDSYLDTGYFELGDGTSLANVDWVIPDMKWSRGTSTPGSVSFTFYVTDYPGNPEVAYGPFTSTSTTPYFNCRFRGRYVRIHVESDDTGTFWRLGSVTFRWAPAGRR
jgi:hypothetical protein